jgi:hypothetical protein
VENGQPGSSEVGVRPSGPEGPQQHAVDAVRSAFVYGRPHGRQVRFAAVAGRREYPFQNHLKTREETNVVIRL